MDISTEEKQWLIVGRRFLCWLYPSTPNKVLWFHYGPSERSSIVVETSEKISSNCSYLSLFPKSPIKYLWGLNGKRSHFSFPLLGWPTNQHSSWKISHISRSSRHKISQNRILGFVRTASKTVGDFGSKLQPGERGFGCIPMSLSRFCQQRKKGK